MIDRRFGSRNTKSSPTPVNASSQSSPTTTSRSDSASPSAGGSPSIQSEALSQKFLHLELEPVISRHFIDSYYELIINPESHLDFYDDWINDLQAVMSKSKALRYSMLANSAAHLSTVNGSSSMNDLALSYYSHSMSALVEAIDKKPESQDPNAVLMSVMLLYLHGVSETARCHWYNADQGSTSVKAPLRIFLCTFEPP